MSASPIRPVHALFPGSFDPFTLGHLDVLERARGLFARVTLGLAVHHSKSSMFPAAERLQLLERLTAEMSDVSVARIDGLIVEAAHELEADVVVRGLRSSIDFEYERTMALTNRALRATHETVFLVPDPALAHISSTLVRQIAQLGGDVSAFVPPAVLDALAARPPGPSTDS